MVDPLIVIVGPTASGKTALAIELAEKFGGEIVCADSRTVYRGLDIGTAKPTPEDQQRVKHHLLDVVNPDEAFTVVDFQRLANQVIKDISSRGKLPFLVGGSGLYIDSVLFDYGFNSNGSSRDKNNPRHMSKDARATRKDLRDNCLIIGLSVSQEQLRERIQQRVDTMVEGGLITEAERSILSYPDSKALDAPGYKAVRSYLEKSITLDQAKDLFVRNDMQLAKRQRTWFRRPVYNNSIHWTNNRDEVIDMITTLLNKNYKS